jgi:large subunit ribosomal protein L25
LPADLPEFIVVDLANLQSGHSIHVSHLTLPEGVEATLLHRGEDPPVASISSVRGETVEAAEAAPSAQAAG